MDHRIVWIHGIGDYHEGYSADWEKAFNAYLQFPHTDYVEVLWATLFNLTLAAPTTTGAAPVGLHGALTRKEQLRAAEVQAELEMVMGARASAFRAGNALAAPHGKMKLNAPVDRAHAASPTETFQMPDWFGLPKIHIGEFVQYLVSRQIRTAVKERMKAQLRPLAGGNFAISVIAHSWGTVVAYDTLLDMESEQPDLKIANLFTLGCPLWAVRHLLDDSSGRKPGELTDWVNIEAQGDFVGASLSPGFQVDHDYEVPDFLGGDPHGSYFLAGNTAVQQGIVAQAILP